MSLDFDNLIPPNAFPIHILRKPPKGRGYPPNCTSDDGTITEGALEQLKELDSVLNNEHHPGGSKRILHPETDDPI